MTTVSPVLFELRDATYRYPEVTALDRVSLDIARGERVTILGANGSGKSTLLRLLDGLCFADGGVVRFDGHELTERAFAEEAFAFRFYRRVGMVFQDPDVQLFNPTVFDEVAFGPLQLRWPREELFDRVHAALARMGIEHLRDRAPHRLSGGEKKRVSLASVLVLDPEVLLLDEPTAALDPRSQGQMVDFLAGSGGGTRTIIATTHDLALAGEIADRCHVFQEGRLAASGPPQEILRDEALLRRTNLLWSRSRR